MTQPSTHIAIMRLLDAYLDGLHYADSGMLQEVFHSDARYINTVAGDYCNLSVPEYFQLLEERVAPAESGQERQGRVVAIEVGGPCMAFAKVEVAMLGRAYNDFLTLLFDNGKWSIITKVFHYNT
ncbi:nuclear transport factor 2 family protein [Billgrantia montanilacus]|uniref:Nuclear transport factor 2 family protein n=1 Tax=Billgrantia montanilacus TaxID=2282305 RepID=A0A368TQF6_9GAMM|nr:nuclear transport factor 2 family protein [Halomonas montanilacus]RCV86830.1 nuclear transport factor 2 family protein [Halomonas montanilacus]